MLPSMQTAQFTLDQVADFSNVYTLDQGSYAIHWYRMLNSYREAWKYYSGDVFNELSKGDEESSPALLFPVKINLVKQACHMHALYMWGKYEKNKVVKFNVLPQRKTVGSAPARAKELTDLFEGILADNSAATLFREHGRLYQAFGGTFFKVRFDPTKSNKIGLIGLSPEYVEPVWNPSDYRDLLRVHVHYLIDASTARELYGYTGTVDSNLINYVETWTKTSYIIRVGDQIAHDPQTGQPMTGPSNLINPLTGARYLPWVYIPRLRTGSFYGQSLVTDLVGIQDELNARIADTGDAVTANAHTMLWGHDLTRRRTRGEMHLTAGEIFDAGDTGPGGEAPFLATLPPPDVQAGVMVFTDSLRDYGRDIAQLSPVMFGQDEGSQRSALTLSMRALPTTSVIDDYRSEWGLGITRICDLSLLTLLGAGEIKGKQFFGHELEIEFASVLPKDREGLVNEVVLRFQTGLISLRRALELLPDVPDVEAELKAIQEEQQAKADEQQAKVDAQLKQQQDQQGTQFEQQKELQKQKQQQTSKAS